jgi:hypothetical protein
VIAHDVPLRPPYEEGGSSRLLLSALISIAFAAIFVILSTNFPEHFSRTNMAALQDGSALSYAIEDGRTVTGFESGDADLAVMAFDAWSRESGRKLKFSRVAEPSKALFRLQWVSAGDGRFGETQRVYVDGKPGAIVYVSIAGQGMGEPLDAMVSRDRLLRDTIVYLTCVHEIGHAIGLQHTRNFEDIMYSFAFGGDIVKYFLRYRDQLKSRSDIPRFSGLSTNDVAVLRTLY